MATQFSTYVEGKVLDAIYNNIDPIALKLNARYVKLHIGAPGAAGTANAAGNTSRQALTGAASAGTPREFTSVNDLIWLSVSTTETYTDVSVWDDPTAGNCLGVGSLTSSKAVTAGDTFTIPTGSYTFTLT